MMPAKAHSAMDIISNKSTLDSYTFKKRPSMKLRQEMKRKARERVEKTVKNMQN
jgi:hypothetical protein